jgi:hypothetical protein
VRHLASLSEVNGGGKELKTDWKTDVDETTSLKDLKVLGEAFSSSLSWVQDSPSHRSVLYNVCPESCKLRSPREVSIPNSIPSPIRGQLQIDPIICSLGFFAPQVVSPRFLLRGVAGGGPWLALWGN